jgi:choline dehydrogenase-like flavoprotein
MSRSLIPRAEAAGARVLTGCRVEMLLRKGRRVTGVLASLRQQDGTEALFRIEAERVFVCAGATETPALLRRSGVRLRVGDSLRIHPMLKVVARFPERLDAHESVLPLLQVKEFWPEVSLGGAFFTPGHAAMILSENWRETRAHMSDLRHMAAYYVAVRGSGKGSVRPGLLGDPVATLRYELSREDLGNLSRGFARLVSLLLAAGATEVYPAVRGLPAIRTEVDAMRWLDEPLPRRALSLTTVHAFSACPAGEREDRCAVDSFGKVYGYENLFVNDASMLPDSPGVNPQGTIMALARRNILHLLKERA